MGLAQLGHCGVMLVKRGTPSPGSKGRRDRLWDFRNPAVHSRVFQHRNNREPFMSDFRDSQNGVNDPVDGVDVKRRFNDNQTPHERAQTAADVRSSAVPAPDEEFLPEALRRRPTGPLNSRTGRRPTE
jgi:hypothetical protein